MGGVRALLRLEEWFFLCGALNVIDAPTGKQRRPSEICTQRDQVTHPSLCFKEPAFHFTNDGKEHSGKEESTLLTNCVAAPRRQKRHFKGKLFFTEQVLRKEKSAFLFYFSAQGMLSLEMADSLLRKVIIAVCPRGYSTPQQDRPVTVTFM